jgi:type IV pilus modification protein PilV
VNRSAQHAPYNQGITLIEILVAIVVVGFGVFGIAKLQIDGLRNTKKAYYMTEALLATQGMAERMRINLVAARLGAYNNLLSATATAKQCDKDKCDDITQPFELGIKQDQEALRNALFQLGYPGYGAENKPNGLIECTKFGNDATRYAAGSYCDVTTWWPDIHQPSASGKTATIDKTCGRNTQQQGALTPCVSIRVMLTQ